MNAARLRVLIVDDDAAMRRALRAALAAHSYAVDEARSGEDAIERGVERPPDLVLLDVDMPGIGGIAACRRLRSILPDAGVIMITVCDREDDKVRALEAGADDYITKPFSVREMIARLRAIARRLVTGPPDNAVHYAGDLELDTSHHTLRKNGVAVRLSPIEFDLLAYLMQHANTPIHHTRLLQAVWGPEYGSELEYLRTYVKRLRKKIEEDAMTPKYLITVPWLGYSFCSPAEPAPAAMSAGVAGT